MKIKLFDNKKLFVDLFFNGASSVANCLDRVFDSQYRLPHLTRTHSSCEKSICEERSVKSRGFSRGTREGWRDGLGHTGSQ